MAGESNNNHAHRLVRPPLLFQFQTLAPPAPPFWPIHQQELPQQQQQQLPAPMIVPPPDFGCIQRQPMQQQQFLGMHQQPQSRGFSFGNLNFQRAPPAPDLNRPPLQVAFMAPQQQHSQQAFQQQPQQQLSHQVFQQQQQQVLPMSLPQPKTLFFKEAPLIAVPLQQQAHKTQQQQGGRSPMIQPQDKAAAQSENIYPVALATQKDVVGDAQLFFKTLSKLSGDLGCDLAIPRVGGKEFEIHRLYCEVTEHGGLEKVTREKKWKDIATAFDLPRTVTSPVYFLRKLYVNLLHHYEQVYYHGKQGPLVPPTDALPMPLPVSQQFHPVDSESVKKKRGRTKFDQLQTNKVNPAAALGNVVTGAIEGKFEHGYFVTVVVGSEKLRGVIYNLSQGETEVEEEEEGEEEEEEGEADTTEALKSPEQSTPKRAKLPKPTKSPIQVSREKKRSRVSRKKDPNAIKPIRNAYNFFVGEQRQKLKGTGGRDEMSRIIGNLWKELSLQDRVPYVEMAQKDKERFNRESKMESGGDQQEDEENEEDDDEPEQQQGSSSQPMKAPQPEAREFPPFQQQQVNFSSKEQKIQQETLVQEQDHPEA